MTQKSRCARALVMSRWKTGTAGYELKDWKEKDGKLTQRATYTLLRQKQAGDQGAERVLKLDVYYDEKPNGVEAGGTSAGTKRWAK